MEDHLAANGASKSSSRFSIVLCRQIFAWIVRDHAVVYPQEAIASVVVTDILNMTVLSASFQLIYRDSVEECLECGVGCCIVSHVSHYMTEADDVDPLIKDSKQLYRLSLVAELSVNCLYDRNCAELNCNVYS
ncbi:hypothetical protein EZV62_026297 [Acer yangbiense]|uniref:Uncharacterized protein n=1 Tax=Acer yangbiense TaxID=1000413 RepID=A0A5C7GQZ3_9ROSI|nr:hypothetical protein EZV62_026297 [Acer yangbiense]